MIKFKSKFEAKDYANKQKADQFHTVKAFYSAMYGCWTIGTFLNEYTSE